VSEIVLGEELEAVKSDPYGRRGRHRTDTLADIFPLILLPFARFFFKENAVLFSVFTYCKYKPLNGKLITLMEEELICRLIFVHYSPYLKRVKFIYALLEQ
jgi:hypothetical protein